MVPNRATHHIWWILCLTFDGTTKKCENKNLIKFLSLPRIKTGRVDLNFPLNNKPIPLTILLLLYFDKLFPGYVLSKSWNMIDSARVTSFVYFHFFMINNSCLTVFHIHREFTGENLLIPFLVTTLKLGNTALLLFKQNKITKHNKVWKIWSVDPSQFIQKEVVSLEISGKHHISALEFFFLIIN